MKKFQLIFISIFLVLVTATIYILKDRFEYYPQTNVQEESIIPDKKKPVVENTINKLSSIGSFKKDVKESMKGFSPEEKILFQNRMKKKNKSKYRSFINQASQWEFEDIVISNSALKIAKSNFVISTRRANEDALNIVGKLNDKFVVVESENRPKGSMWLVEKRDHLYAILTGFIKIQLFDMSHLDSVSTLLGKGPYDRFDHLKIVFFEYDSLNELEFLEEKIKNSSFIQFYEVEVLENTDSSQ